MICAQSNLSVLNFPFVFLCNNCYQLCMSAYVNFLQLASTNWLLLLLLFVIGSIFGSFFNVLIYRLPRDAFWRYRRSHCPHCEQQIPFYLNIPLVSFLLLRGRTACCQQKLAVQYPLVELSSALLVAGLFFYAPFISLDSGIGVDYNQLMRYLHATIFCCLLLVASVIDLHHMIIPDEISLTMVALTPLVVYLHPELDWQSASIGVVLGGGVIYAIAWGYQLIRGKVGMGMGDAKLLAGMGGWLGWQAVLPTLLYASLLGTLTAIILIPIGKKRYNFQSALPFGPFLALGSVIHLFFGQELQSFLKFY